MGDVARLVGADPERLVLEYAHVPGRPGGPGDHGAAGAWLARLHALPDVPGDGVDLADALRIRWARAWDLAEPALSEADRRTLASWFAPAGGPRTWCHRDFREANWIVGERLVVIDFEHAGPDGPLSDLVKLVPTWCRDPAAEAAFRASYGPWDEAALRSWTSLWILGTLGWARRHGDPTFEADARRVLAADRWRW